MAGDTSVRAGAASARRYCCAAWWMAAALLLLALALGGCGGDEETPAAGEEEEAAADTVPAGLYVAGSSGDVYRIDPDTGNQTLVVSTQVAGIYALAFDPTTNTVFVASNARGCQGCLYSVDLTTGTATVIEGSGTMPLIEDLTVRPGDGTLFALAWGECPDLVTIDKASGARNTVEFPACNAVALTHDGAGDLHIGINMGVESYHVQFDEVNGEQGSQYYYVFGGGFAGGPTYLRSMAPHPTQDAFVGITNTNELGVVGRCSADVAYLAAAADAFYALALVPGTSLPAPAPCLP